ncbi:MAG: RNA-binding S4 domain-containing protein [Peptostreptococcales bacterium]
MKEVVIKDDFIKLTQLLKLADLVSSGGESKNVILDGLVKLNGNVEIKKGKKIYRNDIVEYDGQKIIVK